MESPIELNQIIQIFNSNTNFENMSILKKLFDKTINKLNNLKTEINLKEELQAIINTLNEIKNNYLKADEETKKQYLNLMIITNENIKKIN